MSQRNSLYSKLLVSAIAAYFLAACAHHGPVEQNISPELNFEISKTQTGKNDIAYYKVGDGPAQVYLVHGIPTSSYLWRNVAPLVGEAATTVAFDLPGYGESDLPENGDYTYEGLYAPLANYLDSQPGPFVLVVNDLGSLLGIDYAMQNPERVTGLVLVEALFMPAEPWLDQLGGMQKAMFRMMRSNGLAKFMITNKPRLQSMALGLGTLRKYQKIELETYLAPYADPERRRVVLEGPGPATMPKGAISQATNDFPYIANRNADSLIKTDIPILLLTSEPGFIVRKEAIEYAKASFKNLTVKDMGAGQHFLPEDQPTAIGHAIRDWIVETAVVEGNGTSNLLEVSDD